LQHNTAQHRLESRGPEINVHPTMQSKAHAMPHHADMHVS
jgi:hypothetical protein